MIQLHPGALMFKVSSGEVIPCSAEQVTIEFIGEACESLDPDIVRNAAQAVLHYFKVEQGKTQVSVGEFAVVLARVLRGFGLEVTEADKDEPFPAIDPESVAETDLVELAADSGKGFELAFFPHLRAAFKEKLSGSPRVVRFTGLRGCTKRLTGARRWTPKCQQLSDQIVEFLRQCLASDDHPDRCSLVVF